MGYFNKIFGGRVGRHLSNFNSYIKRANAMVIGIQNLYMFYICYAMLLNAHIKTYMFKRAQNKSR
jgi:hypothetical protein